MISFTEVQKILIENRKKLLKKRIEAVGIGYKVVDGKQTRELSIICSVRKKLPMANIAKKDLIPGEIKKVKTDVIEVGTIKALHDKRHRPAPGGVSIGHVDITAGTLGCVVRDGDTRYILSNNHVLANSNDANIGDAVIQPGSYDGGSYPNDHIADLSAFVPINFIEVPSECPIANVAASLINGVLKIMGRRTQIKIIKQAEKNLVDAAIATPLQNENVNNEIMDIGTIKGVESAILGMKIQKSGRTTGLTQGEILQVNVSVNVQYGENRVAQFDDQLIAGAMCAGGDSGSAVLDDNNNIIGLLFAGSETSTVINRIENVFGLLHIHL